MFINRFSKQLVLIPYFKTIIVKDIVKLFIKYIYLYKNLLDTIISNYRL